MTLDPATALANPAVQSRKASRDKAKVITAQVKACTSTSKKMAATDQKQIAKIKEASTRPAGLAAESLGSGPAGRHNAWALEAATASEGGSLSSRQSLPAASQTISGLSFIAFHLQLAKDAPLSSIVALSPMSPRPSEIVWMSIVEAMLSLSLTCT